MFVVVKLEHHCEVVDVVVVAVVVAEQLAELLAEQLPPEQLPVDYSVPSMGWEMVAEHSLCSCLSFLSRQDPQLGIPSKNYLSNGSKCFSG